MKKNGSSKASFPNRSRKGVALLYAAMLLTVMCALASLGVDYGRVQLCKMELRRSADAAARAAAGGLNTSPAAAQALAIQYAAANPTDGTPVVLDPAQGDIQFGKWIVDPTGKAPPVFQVLTGAAALTANAVHVTAHRTAARGDAVPLLFAQVLGSSFCDVSADSIAMYIPAVNVNQTVLATANPYLAGEPAGAVASLNNPHNSPDYAGTATNPRQSPQVVAGLPLVAGDVLNFDDISGTVGHDPTLAAYAPDGELDDIGWNLDGSEHGISNLRAPINALVGVFLTDSVPDSTPAPQALDFQDASARDFQTLKPQVKQLFFIGDGKRSDGTPQQFVVPPGATRFYVATWDYFEWNNNYGQRTVKVSRPGNIITVK